VPKDVLDQLRFEERITRYGHEDTLFGYRLREIHKDVVHIDNPVLHAGLVANREFLSKTDEALQSLLAITGFVNEDPQFRETVTLLQYVSHLEKRGTAWLIRILFIITGPFVRRLLGWGMAVLPLFSFYKAGRYLMYKKRKRKENSGR
jgi:hypothetical protein